MEVYRRGRLASGVATFISVTLISALFKSLRDLSEMQMGVIILATAVIGYSVGDRIDIFSDLDSLYWRKAAENREKARMENEKRRKWLKNKLSL